MNYLNPSPEWSQYPIDHGFLRRKLAAWAKASVIPGQPEAWVRWDCDYRVIHWDDYGLLTEFGWEIDHILMKAFGGPDELFNLRARHWRGNRSAGATMANALLKRAY